MTSASGARPRLDAALIRLGIVVLLGIIVSIIDGTMMVVAIDAVSQEFAASTQTIQWVTGAYLLATCVAIPASGYAVNRFSARTVWLLSLATFLVASMLCGLAWSTASLIFFRVIQGLSGGLIGMVATIVLTRAAGPDRAGRAFSMIAVPSSLAPVLGPIVAGVIIDAASWRWLFYAQVPLLAGALVAAWYVLPRDAKDRRAQLDWTGLLLVAPGLSALVYGLSEVAGTRGSGLTDTLAGLTAVAAMVLGLLLMAGFVVHSVRYRGTPIIDLRLFADRGFAVACGLLFVVGFLLYGLLFLVPLYYQQAAGLSATTAGALLAPQGAGMGLAAIFVGSLNDRFGTRPVVLAGLALTMLGTVAFARVDAHPDDTLLAISLGLRGIGLAATSIPLAAALYQSGLPKEAIPHIATASAVVMRLGGAVGAAMAAVSLLLAAPPGTVAGSTPASAFADAFWWLTLLLVAPFLLALFLPGTRTSRYQTAESPQVTSAQGGSP